MKAAFPPVWIISLERSQDRRTAIAGNLIRPGIHFEFYTAQDGQQLSPHQTAQCDQQQASRLLGRTLMPSEIGLSLSHFDLYRRQIAEQHDIVMIVEDDAFFESDLTPFVEQALLLPHDWDVLHLHDGGRAYPPVFSVWGRRSMGNHVRLRPTTPIDLTHAYLLRRTGAEKLLQRGLPVRVPQDVLTGGTIDIGLRIFGIKPSIATQGSFETTLPDASIARAAIASASSQAAANQPVALRAFRFLRERAMRFYQRVSPFARLKLVR